MTLCLGRSSSDSEWYGQGVVEDLGPAVLERLSPGDLEGVSPSPQPMPVQRLRRSYCKFILRFKHIIRASKTNVRAPGSQLPVKVVAHSHSRSRYSGFRQMNLA